MTDRDYAWWAAAIAGEKPPIHEGDIQCGYFKVRDRRGLNKDLAPIKRPWIVCAIWRGEDGILQAELGGQVADPEALWPYVAKGPIPYDDYDFFKKNERFPEVEA